MIFARFPPPMPVGGIVVWVGMKPPLWLATTRKRLWRVRAPRTTAGLDMSYSQHMDAKTKMITILQMTFTNSFSFLKIVFLCKFHWNFFQKSPITIKAPLVPIMAWCRISSRPWSETMMTYRVLPHICVTQPQWNKLWRRHICFTT